MFIVLEMIQSECKFQIREHILIKIYFFMSLTKLFFIHEQAQGLIP